MPSVLFFLVQRQCSPLKTHIAINIELSFVIESIYFAGTSYVYQWTQLLGTDNGELMKHLASFNIYVAQAWLCLDLRVDKTLCEFQYMYLGSAWTNNVMQVSILYSSRWPQEYEALEGDPECIIFTVILYQETIISDILWYDCRKWSWSFGCFKVQYGKNFSIVIIISVRFFKIGVLIDTRLTLQKERLLQDGRDKELALRSIHKKRHKS